MTNFDSYGEWSALGTTAERLTLWLGTVAKTRYEKLEVRIWNCEFGIANLEFRGPKESCFRRANLITLYFSSEKVLNSQFAIRNSKF